HGTGELGVRTQDAEGTTLGSIDFNTFLKDKEFLALIKKKVVKGITFMACRFPSAKQLGTAQEKGADETGLPIKAAVGDWRWDCCTLDDANNKWITVYPQPAGGKRPPNEITGGPGHHPTIRKPDGTMKLK